MRINAGSTLTQADVQAAVNAAVFNHGQDISLMEWSQGPKGAKEFFCESLNGRYSIGRNDAQGHSAASWTAWGWVIAELFTRDPSAHIGAYRGRDHFIRSIYRTQHHYITRQSLGVTRDGRGDYEHGGNCEFLSLFDGDLLAERYRETFGGAM